MENPEESNDELFETELDEEILHKGMMLKMNDRNDAGERDEWIGGSDSASEICERSDAAQLATKSQPSEQLCVQQEMPEKALLDLVFGELPPKSLIKSKLLFTKPIHPKKRPQTKQCPLFISNEICVADGERPQEVHADDVEMDDQHKNTRKCFVRIGGMLAIPVPVPGPLFTNEEQLPQNARLALYDKYVPEPHSKTKPCKILVSRSSLSPTSCSANRQDQIDIESYKLAQSSWNTLSFALDFPKPSRPGTKARSKPSDLQRNKVTKQDKLESPPIEATSETSAFQLSELSSQSAPQEPTEDTSKGSTSLSPSQEPIMGITPQVYQEPMPGPTLKSSLGPKSHKRLFKLFSLFQRKKSSHTLAIDEVDVSKCPSITNETPSLVAASSMTQATSKKNYSIVSKKQNKSIFPHAKINSQSSALQLSTPPPESPSRAPEPALPETPTARLSRSQKGVSKSGFIPRTKKSSPILASKAVSVSTFPSMANETKSPPALAASSSTTQATSKMSSTRANTSISPSSLEVTSPHLAAGQTVLPEVGQTTSLFSTPSVKSVTDTQVTTSLSDPFGAAMKGPEEMNFNRATSTLTPGTSLKKKAVSRSAPLPGAKWVQKLF